MARDVIRKTWMKSGSKQSSSPMMRIRRCDPDVSASLDPLWRRLAETIDWCKRNVNVHDPQGCLRHSDTRPRYLERDYFSAVSTTASVRRHRVAGQPATQSLQGGRLLV